MKGVTKHHGPGEVAAKALIVGNDVLTLPDDIEKCFSAIKKYISEGKLKQERVEESVKKILRAKYRLGLTSPQVIEEENIRTDLNSKKALALKQKLVENSMTDTETPLGFGRREGSAEKRPRSNRHDIW